MPGSAPACISRTHFRACRCSAISNGTIARATPMPTISIRRRCGEDEALRIRTRNAGILLELANCDRGVCPTAFQRDQFPPELRGKLTVIHDGVDTGYFAPSAQPAALRDVPAGCRGRDVCDARPRALSRLSAVHGGAGAAAGAAAQAACGNRRRRRDELRTAVRRRARLSRRDARPAAGAGPRRACISAASCRRTNTARSCRPRRRMSI